MSVGRAITAGLLLAVATALLPAPARAEPASRRVGRRYFGLYEAGDMQALYEAGTDAYRRNTCQGEPSRCPRIGAVEAAGRTTGESLTCGRRGCTYRREITYAHPPDFPGMHTHRWLWQVHMTREGRLRGIDVTDPDRDRKMMAGAAHTFVTMAGYACPGALVLFTLLLGVLWTGRRTPTHMGREVGLYRGPVNGLLLVNLGTPDDTSVSAVRRYLGEFLADPRVIDLSPLGRWLLLHAIILRVRPRKSAEAYRKIWREDGSPLLVYSRALADEVRARLGDGWKVELAMRYGRPALHEALERLVDAGAEPIVVLPLYPQEASSSTGSTLEKVYALAADREVVPALSVVPPFFEEPGFLDAAARVGRGVLEGFGADHVLMSFHGLPERHLRASDPTGTHCLASETCCDDRVPANRHCYRHQCFETARALATRLGLEEGRWSVSFQSRLGRTPWIHPYTDHVIPRLVERGVKRLAVFTPSFVADCLETLEEIGIRGRDQFLSLGGEAFVQVPCVNAEPGFADAVAAMARRMTAGVTGDRGEA